MEQTRYLISDAAKQVEVESHVLRYWEEELGIPIKRNELGHRYYTSEDVERFREIKRLKEQGLQLKAIRMVLKNGKLERLKGDGFPESVILYRENLNDGGAERVVSEQEKHMIEIISKRDIADRQQESKEEKSIRLQMLLQHMIGEAVRESSRELCEDIKQSVLKEMDYQFRQQEEREEERENERRKREEEHYQKVDELLRSYSKRKRPEKEKIHRFGAKKKPSTV